MDCELFILPIWKGKTCDVFSGKQLNGRERMHGALCITNAFVVDNYRKYMFFVLSFFLVSENTNLTLWVLVTKFGFYVTKLGFYVLLLLPMIGFEIIGAVSSFFFVMFVMMLSGKAVFIHMRNYVYI